MQHVSSDPLISDNSGFNFLLLHVSLRSKAPTKNSRVFYIIRKSRPESRDRGGGGVWRCMLHNKKVFYKYLVSNKKIIFCVKQSLWISFVWMMIVFVPCRLRFTPSWRSSSPTWKRRRTPSSPCSASTSSTRSWSKSRLVKKNRWFLILMSIII